MSGPTTRSRRGPGEAAARQPLTHLVTGAGGEHAGRRDQRLCANIQHVAQHLQKVKKINK